MKIEQKKIPVSTRGFNDIINISDVLQQAVADTQIKNGYLLVFIPGSTAGITTIEYEPGLLRDIPEMLDRIAPTNTRYHHDDTWHDGNGYAHVRAALIGPSLMIPIEDRRLVLGTWQQVVLIDFDNRPRKRTLHLQVAGQ